MKKIIFFLLLLCSLFLRAQVPNTVYYNWTNGAVFNGPLTLPSDTPANAKIGSFSRKGNNIYLKDSTGFWKLVGGGSPLKVGNGLTAYTSSGSTAKDSAALGGRVTDSAAIYQYAADGTFAKWLMAKYGGVYPSITQGGYNASGLPLAETSVLPGAWRAQAWTPGYDSYAGVAVDGIYGLGQFQMQSTSGVTGSQVSVIGQPESLTSTLNMTGGTGEVSIKKSYDPDTPEGSDTAFYPQVTTGIYGTNYAIYNPLYSTLNATAYAVRAQSTISFIPNTTTYPNSNFTLSGSGYQYYFTDPTNTYSGVFRGGYNDVSMMNTNGQMNIGDSGWLFVRNNPSGSFSNVSTSGSQELFETTGDSVLTIGTKVNPLAGRKKRIIINGWASKLSSSLQPSWTLSDTTGFQIYGPYLNDDTSGQIMTIHGRVVGRPAVLGTELATLAQVQAAAAGGVTSLTATGGVTASASTGAVTVSVDTTTRNTGIPNYGRSIALGDSVARRRASDSVPLIAPGAIAFGGYNRRLIGDANKFIIDSATGRVAIGGTVGGQTFTVYGSMQAMSGGGFIASNGGAGLNNGTTGQGTFTVPTTGPTITHNIADANPALLINQVNASSTGPITTFQSAGVSRAFVDMSGTFGGLGLYNVSSANNASITVSNTGASIVRNIADANPAAIINLANASAVGNVVTFQKAGAAVARITQTGVFKTAAIAPYQYIGQDSALPPKVALDSLYDGVGNTQTITGQKTYARSIKSDSLTGNTDIILTSPREVVIKNKGNTGGYWVDSLGYTRYGAPTTRPSQGGPTHQFVGNMSISSVAVGSTSTDTSFAVLAAAGEVKKLGAATVKAMLGVQNMLFFPPTIINTSSSYTMAGQDYQLIQRGGGNAIITLPNPATAGAGRVYKIKNAMSSYTVGMAISSGTGSTSFPAGEKSSLGSLEFATYQSDGTYWWQIDGK